MSILHTEGNYEPFSDMQNMLDMTWKLAAGSFEDWMMCNDF
jgi:hypothetical protein